MSQAFASTLSQFVAWHRKARTAFCLRSVILVHSSVNITAPISLSEAFSLGIQVFSLQRDVESKVMSSIEGYSEYWMHTLKAQNRYPEMNL